MITYTNHESLGLQPLTTGKECMSVCLSMCVLCVLCVCLCVCVYLYACVCVYVVRVCMHWLILLNIFHDNALKC